MPQISLTSTALTLTAYFTRDGRLVRLLGVKQSIQEEAIAIQRNRN